MRNPSPALVVALVALAVALGGTGYAVTQLPRNSVGTKQIRNNAVTGAKVKAGSLEASDFKPGSLPRGAQGDRGPQGPAGERGAQGATGERGAQGEAGPTFSFSDSQVLGTPVDITFLTTVISHSVTIPRAGTLTGNVTGRLFIGTGTTGSAAKALCRVRVAPANVSISQEIPSGTATQENSVAGDALMSLTFGYAVPAAGTYTLNVICTRYQLTGTPTLGLDRYDINGVLAGS